MEFSRIPLLLPVLSSLLYLLLLTNASEEKGKCSDIILDVTEEDMLSLSECIKDTGAESWKDLAVNRLPCFGKCVITKQELVDESGAPHAENILSAVNSSVPDLIRDDLVKLMEKCLDDFGSQVDPSEESCDSYVPLVECFHGSFTDSGSRMNVPTGKGESEPEGDTTPTGALRGL